MTQERNANIGESGENVAISYLVAQGFKVLDRNFRRPYGEIDIVAQKDRALHFVEVKTSKYYPETAFSPEIRVNKRKISALKRICERYLSEHSLQDEKWQIDVISVILDRQSVRSIELFENAVFEKRY